MPIETQDPQTVGAGDMRILGHVAIHALRGAVRGLQQAAAARQAAAPRRPPKPAAPPAAKPAPAPPPRLPADRYALARAQIYSYGVRALKIAHDLSHADENPAAAQRALLEAARSQQVGQKLKEMGVPQDGHVDTYEQAREQNLDTKLARSQVLLVPSPSGGVDIFDVSPELQKSVAVVLEPSAYDPHPASGRIWGEPPKSKSGQENDHGETQQKD